MEKQEIIKKLLKNVDKETKDVYKNEKFQVVNAEKWTLADLFIRQWLNNGCDGFGMKNVCGTYVWLKTIKNDLIKNDLISPCGLNNSGFTLWTKYDF